MSLSLSPSDSQPTAAMLAFYDQRTRQHIARVAQCLARLAENSPDGQELLARAKVHDASKFAPEEYLPYVWLTEFHRCRRTAEPFLYPEGMEIQVEAAVRHHLTCNRHHPEFHEDLNSMSRVDLAEMVCDWTAMAQEFGENGGSARSWAQRTIGHRVKFSAEAEKYIYMVIGQLDAETSPQADTTDQMAD